MTFKARLTMAAALAVAVAIALASFVAYLIVRQELRTQVDSELERLASRTRFIDGPGLIGMNAALPEPSFGGASGYAQLVGPEGPVLRSGDVSLPYNARTIAVASGEADDYFTDMSVGGTHIRVLTQQVAPGLAVQIARPMDEVDEILQRLRWILIIITGCGIALATGLGGVVSRATLVPVRRLTDATEHITSTSDLGHRIQVDASNDELSRLAASFNSMLDALDESLGAQRQLVADASHELRTPLTSLRTNIEVLGNEDRLDASQREELRADIVSQLDELTSLIGDVVDLARGNEPEMLTEEFRLDDVVLSAVERTQKASPALNFDVVVEACVVEGSAQRIERAVNNLLSNAIKWSPGGGPVEVRLSGGELTVRDYGPGIPEEDRPRVFDRFYRASSARGMPGSGLGLAIVRQVAESHGGTAAAEAAPGGGALFRLRFPVVPVEAHSRSDDVLAVPGHDV